MSRDPTLSVGSLGGADSCINKLLTVLFGVLSSAWRE